MKIKKVLILFMLFTLCYTANVYAEGINSDVFIDGRNVTITGYHYSSQPSDCVTLLVTKSGRECK